VKNSNYLYKTINRFWQAGIYGNSPVEKDPKFTNVNTNNFGLQALSPAIGAGLNVKSILDKYSLNYGIKIDWANSKTGDFKKNSWNIGAPIFGIKNISKDKK